MHMTNFFDFLTSFIRCFKSSPALTSWNISETTSVKLVHTLSNNFYLGGLSISSKTETSITVRRCFKSSPALTSWHISQTTSVKLVHTLSNNFYLGGFSTSSKTRPSITDAYGYFFRFFNYVFRMFQKVPSPNQLKYLTSDFSKVSSHFNQQLLQKRFFYKFKNWTKHYWCIWLIFSIF
jgi:hypothetical protein